MAQPRVSGLINRLYTLSKSAHETLLEGIGTKRGDLDLLVEHLLSAYVRERWFGLQGGLKIGPTEWKG